MAKVRRVIVELDKEVVCDDQYTSNRMAYGLMQIVRMPPPNVPDYGKKVGDRIEGRIVLQYAGPLTLIVEPDKKVPNPKKTQLNPMKPAVQRRLKRASKSARPTKKK